MSTHLYHHRLYTVAQFAKNGWRWKVFEVRTNLFGHRTRRKGELLMSGKAKTRHAARAKARQAIVDSYMS
jgi:hypothetical protein